jgi:hypothetical protein
MSTETTEAATTVPPVPTSDAILGPVAGPAGGWPSRHRYGLLAGAVVVLTSIQTLNGQWSSDMWEHVAVVRELIAHPFDPMHPLVRADAPHPGFSPYTVALGVLGDLTGAGAIAVLSVAAVLNIVLLLLAFRLLVVELTDNERAPFWALLFVLLLWGFTPYRYSGFFGLNSIGFVAPFPSTFATAVAFGTIVAACRFARSGRLALLAPIALGTALVILVHPLSAPWLLVALLAVAVARLRDPASWAWAAGAMGAALALCLLWPYYSVTELLGGSAGLEALNQSMYSRVALRLFPAFLGLVVIWRRSRADHRDLLGLFLAGATGLWLVGAVTDNTSFGRALPFVVIVLDIALADGAARLEAHTVWRDAPRAARIGVGAVATLLVLGLVTTAPGWVRMVPTPLLPASVGDADELARPDERLAFLTDAVGSTEVVVAARADDNRVVPALAGRTLALAVPRPFVSDADERLEAQRELLDASTSAARRREIEDRFDVRFVLLRVGDQSDEALLSVLLGQGGTVVHEDEDFLLVALEGTESA